MSHDVFVCHPFEDKPTADAVVASLEADRVRCWIAPRDVLPGEEWPEAIVRAIHDAHIVVLVFSEHSNESGHVMREVQNAVQGGKPIIPFRIADVAPSPGLDYFIGGTHWLDALTPPLEAHLTKLTGTVRALLAREEPNLPEAQERDESVPLIAVAPAVARQGDAHPTPDLRLTTREVAPTHAGVPDSDVAPHQSAFLSALRRPSLMWAAAGALAAATILIVGLVVFLGGNDERRIEVLDTTIVRQSESATGVIGLPAVTSTTARPVVTAPIVTPAPTTTIASATTISTPPTTTPAPAPPTTRAPTTTRTTATTPTTTTTTPPTTTTLLALSAANDSYQRTDRSQVCLDVLGNDSGTAPLSVIAVSSAEFGSATPAACGVLYTPPDVGTRLDAFLDTFTYTVRDGSGATASAGVSVSVR